MKEYVCVCMYTSGQEAWYEECEKTVQVIAAIIKSFYFLLCIDKNTDSKYVLITRNKKKRNEQRQSKIKSTGRY